MACVREQTGKDGLFILLQQFRLPEFLEFFIGQLNFLLVPLLHLGINMCRHFEGNNSFLLDYLMVFFLRTVILLIFVHLQVLVSLQLVELSLLSDFSSLQHIDLITVHDGPHPMCDSDCSLLLCDFVQSCLDIFLVSSV